MAVVSPQETVTTAARVRHPETVTAETGDPPQGTVVMAAMVHLLGEVMRGAMVLPPETVMGGTVVHLPETVMTETTVRHPGTVTTATAGPLPEGTVVVLRTGQAGMMVLARKVGAKERGRETRPGDPMTPARATRTVRGRRKRIRPARTTTGVTASRRTPATAPGAGTVEATERAAPPLTRDRRRPPATQGPAASPRSPTEPGKEAARTTGRPIRRADPARSHPVDPVTVHRAARTTVLPAGPMTVHRVSQVMVPRDVRMKVHQAGPATIPPATRTMGHPVSPRKSHPAARAAIRLVKPVTAPRAGARP